MPPVVAEVIGIVEGCDAAIHQSAYTNIAGGIGLTAEVPFRIGNCVALAAGIELEEVIVLELSMTVESGPRIFAQKEPRFWVDGGHDGERPIRRSWSGLHSLIGRG